MPPKKRARTKTGTSRTLGRNDAPTRTPSPPTSNPCGTPIPPEESAPSRTTSNPAGTSATSRLGVSLPAKPANWANLEALIDTLKQGSAVTGLGTVKSVMEGLVELIGLHEDTVQGKTDFDDLRIELECIFDELNHHLSTSPIITTSMENICWSIQNEIESVKARQARPRKRKSDEEGDDAYVALGCYQRIKDHLQRLTRNANISTWKLVDQLATESRLQKLASSLWECYNSIKANELQRGSCTAGTRIGVLAQMHHWATTPNTGAVYWMSGMAGTGKTTIAYTLCEQLDGKDNRVLCASFFCSRSLPECRDVGRIIPSIAYQLARCSQPFRYALSQTTERNPDAHTRLPHDQFETLIVQPLSDEKVKEAFPTNMVVVIDALDECNDAKSTKQILVALLTKTKDLPIKFVVSSRPEPAIRDQMEKNGTWVDARVVLHELDSGEVKVDIKTYLTAGLQPITPSEVEIEELAERAGVLFIYAATVIRYVGYDDFGRNPRARLKAILAKTGQHVKAQTKDIDELYGIVLAMAFDDSTLSEEEQGDIRLILHTAICAREPLTVAALNNLLQLGDVDRVQAALRPLWSVLHVMGPNMTVTTLHASFPDYLLDSKRSGAWHCDAVANHCLLAQCCFKCIRVAKPQFNICRLESSYVLDSEVADLNARVQRFISTELRYACLYWFSHLDAVESRATSELTLLLSQFLTKHLLLWMEVRNLTNTFPATLGELIAARRWVTGHDMTLDAADLLTDAWRFASTFVSSQVSQSTPHLYVSMLPLLPSSNSICKHYSSRFHGMVGVEGPALDRRKSELLAQWKIEGGVSSMSCSLDGALIATNGPSGTIFLLDAFRGNILLHLSEVGRAEVTSIAFFADGARLVSGRSDGRISVWDVSNGQPVFGTFQAHAHSILSVLSSRDGSYIFSVCQKVLPDSTSTGDYAIRIWDALSGKPSLIPLIGHTNSVSCIEISSNDACLVSGSSDCTIRVWDVQSGKLILDPLITDDDPTCAIALAPDDSYVVSGSINGKIRVWDIQTGRMIAGPFGNHDTHVCSMSISPDGTAIASTSHDDSVNIWNSASGKLISKLGPFSNRTRLTHQMTYSHDGTHIIFGLGDGRILIIDTRTAAPLPGPFLGLTGSVTSLDISPNGQQVVSGSKNKTLCVWDLCRGSLLVGPLQGHTDAINMVRYSPDGRRIVSCEALTIRQWDAQSGVAYGMPIKVAPNESRYIVSAHYSRDEARIVSLTSHGEVLSWNSSNGQSVLEPIPSLRQSSGSQSGFSPDAPTVIAGYMDGLIHAWDIQGRNMIFSRQSYTVPRILAVSPSGLYYAQSDMCTRIILRNIHTEEKMPGLFEGHTQRISSMRFSSDSTQLVSGSYDSTVHVWGVETGRTLFGSLKGHTVKVKSVAFSPDGQYVASACSDSVIRVWDLKRKLLTDGDIGDADWVLNKAGWVISGERRLLWVPPNLHRYLMSPRNTTLISPHGYARLKFEGAFIGKAWAGCWRTS